MKVQSRNYLFKKIPLLILLLIFVQLLSLTALSQDAENLCEITEDTVWTAENSVHVIDCEMTIPENVTLTIAANAEVVIQEYVSVYGSLYIEEGAILKFNKDVRLLIYHEMQAIGTVGSPIFFTSIHDDSVGTVVGDASHGPAMGDWGGIAFLFDSEPTSIISHAQIKYSGYYNNGSTTVTAISIRDSSPTIRFVNFDTNLAGIYLNEESYPSIYCNDIVNVSWHALENKANQPVDIRNNWWGSPTGPSHIENSTGRGTRIWLHANYTPWLTTSWRENDECATLATAGQTVAIPTAIKLSNTMVHRQDHSQNMLLLTVSGTIGSLFIYVVQRNKNNS